ncbi:hypothetical protein E2C01_034484 [Portunus trituberculatus]|uniref:Uncharacterized protein n=1 Tax=Portunus trituberculatus TaxID=210409 RepID=A0A5B7F0R0_PORTR|nr:hypothetical protein [Portunus trituberculatus]
MNVKMSQVIHTVLVSGQHHCKKQCEAAVPTDANMTARPPYRSHNCKKSFTDGAQHCLSQEVMEQQVDLSAFQASQ